MQSALLSWWPLFRRESLLATAGVNSTNGGVDEDDESDDDDADAADMANGDDNAASAAAVIVVVLGVDTRCLLPPNDAIRSTEPFASSGNSVSNSLLRRNDDACAAPM